MGTAEIRLIFRLIFRLIQVEKGWWRWCHQPFSTCINLNINFIKKNFGNFKPSESFRCFRPIIPKSTQNYSRMEQKDEIIVRSEQLFLRLGVKSVSMDDIARELGISKKTLYQHFDTKDALVEASVSTHVEREQCMIEQICAAAKDALDEIRNMGAFITASIEDISPGALYDLQKYYYKTWQLLMQKQDVHVADCIVKNIHRGIKEKLYRDDLNPEIVAKIYSKSTYMVVEQIALSASKFTRRQLIWELHNYHVHGIATPKGLRLWEQYSSEMKYYDVPKTIGRI